VLITGGMDGSYNYLKTAELFDPATGTFTATSGTMAVTRANHTATLLSNGKVLITGGGNGSLSADAELYNPVTDTFTSVAATMSAARNYHTATLLQDGRVLIAFGGSNTADVYDPAANAFTQVGATVLLPIIKHSATLLANGKILLVGGEASYCQLDSTYIFDPETGSFVDGPALKQSREAASLITLDDGSVLVVGGQGLAGYLSSCERYR
jgi:N-acetylneuraminic acid mutarotase